MSNELILVVDDNQELADFVAGQLLPSLNYSARVVYSAQAGLQAVRASPPDLMLLDLEMPDMSGLDLLRILAKEERSVPTILVTAHGSEQVATDAFRLGVQDYLTKPVDAEQLDQAITKALSETRLRDEKDRLTIQLQEQVNWQNILVRIGQSITSTLDPSQVLRRIVEAGVQLTHAEEGFLALLDPNSGQLLTRAVKNIDADTTRTMRLPVQDSLVGEVFKTKQPLRVDSQAAGSTVKVVTGFLVNSLLYVPILAKGQPLGVLSVINRHNQRAFDARDERMLVSLADYASVALENARLYQNAQHELQERRRVEQALRESEDRYARALQGANDGIWDWNLKTNRVFFSSRWKEMLGYDESEISDDPKEWLERVHPTDVEKVKLDISRHIRGVTEHFENEHRIQHKDGSYRWVLCRGLAVRDQNDVVSRMAGSQTDITSRKVAEARLVHDAFYDRLTGLPNRSLFMDRLRNAIERARRRKDFLYAVLFLDLDQFKNVNDSLGHPVGDQLLVAIANILRGNLRATDTVARLGGDEFVILLEDIRDHAAASEIAEWVLRQFTSSIRLPEHQVYITTSIGIVLGHQTYSHPEDVLRDADIAMYEAKMQGKATYAVFTTSMRERILKRVEIEADLRLAIDLEQLRIHYQPIFDLKTEKLWGFEALIRWQHPRQGLIAPKEFISVAYETGLINSMDRWVLREVCQQARRWQSQYPQDPPLKVNVNITSKLIAQPDLLATIQGILAETGLAEHTLGLEITEQTVIEYNETISEVINTLKGMGVEIHIDDFGTGYSSLIYLRQFPINALKIDRSFVQQIEEQTPQTEIIKTIIRLAHDLGMRACAEGIETPNQLFQLKELGCDYGQGYLFAKALSLEETSAFLETTLNA
ncbi:MAG: EAL domain-containing protein [Anaerolineales bacterium]|nr:EAL domain-containing protein [Anaerolineales bacterium]